MHRFSMTCVMEPSPESLVQARLHHVNAMIPWRGMRRRPLRQSMAICHCNILGSHLFLQVKMMMKSPVNPYVHMGNDIKGQDYADAVKYFTDRFPDEARLHIMGAHDDQVVGQEEVRAVLQPAHAPACPLHITHHSCWGAASRFFGWRYGPKGAGQQQRMHATCVQALRRGPRVWQGGEGIACMSWCRWRSCSLRRGRLSRMAV